MPRLFTVLPDMPFNPSSIFSNFIFGPITDFKNSKSTKLRLDPVSNKQIVFFFSFIPASQLFELIWFIGPCEGLESFPSYYFSNHY